MNNNDQNDQNDKKEEESMIHQSLYRLGQAILLGGTGVDIGSTAAVLNQGGRETNTGIYGTNPSMARLMLTKAAPTVGALYAMHRIAPNHPKIAGALGMALGSVPMLAGIHNLRQLNRK